MNNAQTLRRSNVPFHMKQKKRLSAPLFMSSNAPLFLRPTVLNNALQATRKFATQKGMLKLVINMEMVEEVGVAKKFHRQVVEVFQSRNSTKNAIRFLKSIVNRYTHNII